MRRSARSTALLFTKTQTYLKMPSGHSGERDHATDDKLVTEAANDAATNSPQDMDGEGLRYVNAELLPGTRNHSQEELNAERLIV